MRVCCLMFAAVLCFGSLAHANPSLYMFDAGGGLLEVDQANGHGQSISSLPRRLYYDMSSRPGDDQHVYSISGERGSAFAPSYLSKIDVQTGQLVDQVVLTADMFGLGDPELFIADAIAISPINPDIAYITGESLDFVVNHYEPVSSTMIRLNLNTLEVVGSPWPMPNIWNALTFTPDGSSILAVNSFFDFDPAGPTKLFNINPGNGQVDFITNTTMVDVTGIAFRPTDGTLFAINAFSTDAIVTLSPDTGQIIETLGPTGLIGPAGLAFVPVPEPGTLCLVTTACVALARRRNG